MAMFSCTAFCIRHTITTWHRCRIFCAAMVFISILLTTPSLATAAGEVNVYSARKEALILPLLEKFGEANNVRINLITGNADTLLQRILSEGRNSPADLLLTTDVARLQRARIAGALQPVDSVLLTTKIPALWRDPEGYWFGLSRRYRIIVYAPERVQKEELSDYLALAEEKWYKRICIRSSTNVYNQSLVAALLHHHGSERTEQWAQRLVKNLARAPKGGDRDQIRAVVAGQCDLAVVNHYYLAGMLNSSNPRERATARGVAVFFPAQQGNGTHTNISGASIPRYAPNRKTAVQLLEYLANTQAQHWFAQSNQEYPVVPYTKDVLTPILQSWGDDFRVDDIPLTILGKRNTEAVLLMDRAGWR